MINKKALSSVVVATLLIVIGIAAITIVAVNINTFLKSSSTQLSPTINCIDLQSKSTIQITSACLNEDTSEIELTIKRSLSNSEISQLDFLLSSDISSQTASYCCGLPDCESCALLKEGEQKTYFFPTSPSESFSKSVVSIGSCELDKKTISVCQ
jgi:hypothetical protein